MRFTLKMVFRPLFIGGERLTYGNASRRSVSVHGLP